MTSPSDPPPKVSCSAGCKREVLLSEAERTGWENLPITGRWRCPQCWRELQAINAPKAEEAP
jgi:hypothetical protein